LAAGFAAAMLLALRHRTGVLARGRARRCGKTGLVYGNAAATGPQVLIGPGHARRVTPVTGDAVGHHPR